MFCTSLRKRLDLQPLLQELTSSLIIKIRELKLETHDLAYNVPEGNGLKHIIVRFLILTPISLDASNILMTNARVERFSTLTGGDSIAIAFLMSTTVKRSKNTESGPHAFSKLQLLIHDHPTLPTIPLIPIPDPPQFLPLLNAYVTALNRERTPKYPTLPSAVTLISQTTSNAPLRPLSEHETNVLSDICHSLPEVASLARSKNGREILRQWLGELAARGVEEFWGEERIWE